jgi:hypothetical protein
VDVRRPHRKESPEAEIIGRWGSVPELYEDGGSVIFGKEFEAAFCGGGHLAFRGEVVDVGDAANKDC